MPTLAVIKIFFSEKGYYISGEGIEVARWFSPATTERGDRIFQPIHHTYKILSLALIDIAKRDATEDVIIFNDSRIIDEINGLADPLDETCSKWVTAIRRFLVPNVRSVIFFRKKSSEYINSIINQAHSKLIINLPEADKQKIADIYAEVANRKKTMKKKRLLQRLKDSWFRRV